MRFAIPGFLGVFLLNAVAAQAQGPLLLSDGSYAFVEQVGPDGADPCGPGAQSTFGCDEVGGNAIYPSLNGTGEYIMASCCDGALGPEETLGAYAPNDFEIRFTAEGSYAAYVFDQTPNGGLNTAVRVPFEMWDIGLTPPGQANDPADDVRMIPALFADTGGTCGFGFAETGVTVDGEDYFATDRAYAYYPLDSLALTYDDWAAFIGPTVDGDPDGCPVIGADVTEAQAVYGGYADFDRGRPLQRVVFLDATFNGDIGILQGSVQRFYTTDTGQDTEDAPESAGAYRLLPVYPNPVRARAEVPFEVTRPVAVRVVVYDVLGRAVAVLADRLVGAGRHEVVFEVRDLDPAVYVVALEVDGALQSRQKVVVAR